MLEDKSMVHDVVAAFIESDSAVKLFPADRAAFDLVRPQADDYDENECSTAARRP